jgi:deoxyadenosine/deoxycytidine kinase
MPFPDQRYLVIAGNIGVGKSTLVELLAQSLGWTGVPELDATPPYLDAYYADPPRWAFPLQIWFLTRRLAKHQQISTLSGTVVQDRSIYEDAAVFAASLHAQGILSAQDYVTYQELYAAISRDLRPPDLIVYLRASVPTLLQRIARRARPAEQAITAAYLASLEQHYADWIVGWMASPVLVIDTDALDSVQNLIDRRALIDQIVARWATLEARPPDA